MKIKVMKEFVDRHTKKLHKVGEVMDVTKERLAEIRKVDKSLVKEVKEAKE
jgi:hypothetical protein